MAFQKGKAGGPGAPKKPHDKTILKIQSVIRLQMQNLGLTDQQLADHIGLKIGSFKILKKTKIYQSLQQQFTTGIFHPIDENIIDSYRRQRNILEVAVPTALENLYQMAIQKIDKKLQFDASKEILDRHGVHAKVSRTGIALPDQGGIASQENNEIATELINNLAAKARTKVIESQPPPTIEDDPASPLTQ